MNCKKKHFVKKEKNPLKEVKIWQDVQDVDLKQLKKSIQIHTNAMNVAI